MAPVRAVNKLDRILKRLKSAITKLLRLSSKKDGLSLDYKSLMSLSNASRVDAIKAIDSLSRRLGSPSRSSVVSSAPSKGSSKVSSGMRHKHSSSRDAAPSTPKPTTKTRQRKPVSEKPPAVVNRKDKAASRHRKADGTESRHKSASRETRPQSQESSAVPPTSPKKTKADLPNRVSILSFSSDSTKLGEIPQRKWQSVTHHAGTDPDGDKYNVRPVFPLQPYTVEVRERRFLGLFRRRQP